MCTNNPEIQTSTGPRTIDNLGQTLNVLSVPTMQCRINAINSPDVVYATVKFVAVCTRVAWFSHKSGVSNAHLLPEVLVNTDTHLDLFDSESEDASDFEELIEVQANG